MYIAAAILCLLPLQLLAVEVQVPSNADIVSGRIDHAQKELDRLKTELSASRRELSSIEQQLVGSFDSDTRLTLRERDTLPQGFELLDAKYTLDGRPLDSQFDDFISRGSHRLQVEKSYRFQDQMYRVQGSVDFTANDGRTTT